MHKARYNELRKKKEADFEYQVFMEAFKTDRANGRFRPSTLELARIVNQKFSLKVSDYDTPITTEGKRQAILLGEALEKSHTPTPDIIICSPYLRTKETKRGVGIGWHTLDDVEVVYDDRIREQEHGLSLLYNDWRVFHTMHPEQADLRDLLGPYWYRYPQGESVSDVRDRNRLFIEMLIREYSGMNVWLFTHHLTILSLRANLERLSPEQFIELDEHQKPVNCGLTTYIGNPNKGKNGKLELLSYNQNLWKRD